MVTVNDDRAQLSYELAVYREQIALIKQETERISLTTVDLSNALNTIENCKEDVSSNSVLIPIGGGTMMKGTLAETKILVPIGAQYLAEMSRKEAETEIKKRIEATKKAVEKLGEEFEKISSKLREASVQLSRMEKAANLSERVEENIREDYI